MLCSKLCRHQGPKQNARSHPNQGPTDIEDTSSAKAMLDRACDAMLEVVPDPEPETLRPKCHGTCFDAEGFHSRRKLHWPATEDVEDNSSAKAMLDHAFDAVLEAVSATEPETERPKPLKPGTDCDKARQ